MILNGLHDGSTPLLSPLATRRRRKRRSRGSSRAVNRPALPFWGKYPLTYSISRLDRITEVTVASQLTGDVRYHWYLDGTYQGETRRPRMTFFLEQDQQAQVECIDAPDDDFDPILQAPAAWPARKTLWWICSTDSDVDHYRVEQNRAAAGWTTLRTVAHEPDRWDYFLTTDRLDDLVSYQWRVIPVDAAGNDGTAVTLSAETIVRTPDAVDYTIGFDEGTTKITFTAA